MLDNKCRGSMGILRIAVEKSNVDPLHNKIARNHRYRDRMCYQLGVLDDTCVHDDDQFRSWYIIPLLLNV